MTLRVRSIVISGAKWTTLSNILLSIFSLIKLSVLTRLLDKADFGLMAIIMLIIGFTEIFSDIGLSTAILHKQNINLTQYSSLYWLNILFSITLLILIGLASPLVAYFYEENELIYLLPLTGSTIVFSAIGRQYRTLLLKDFHFKLLSMIDIAIALVGLVIAIILAVYDYGVFALVYSLIAQVILSNVIIFFIGIKMQGLLFYLKISEIRSFLNIGLFQVGGELINYLNRDLDLIIVGKVFGTETLGAYSLARQLVRKPIQLINPLISKVSSTLFPRYQDDDEKLRNFFEKTFNSVAAINCLIYGLIGINAHWIVNIVYGHSLIDITLYVQLFCLLIFIRSLAGLMGILSITKGRTDYEFYWNMINFFIIPIVLILSSLISTEAMIMSMFVMMMLMMYPLWKFYYYKLISFPLKEYIKSHIYVPLILSVFILISIYMPSDNIIYTAVLSVALCAITALYIRVTIPDFKKIVFNN